MWDRNNISEFILLGLFNNKEVKEVGFVFFSLCYLVILMGNLFILTTIRLSQLNEQPMYFFLSYLSFMDVCFTSTVAPKLILDLLVQRTTISYNHCMAQLFYAHFFGATEIFILVAMAFDRYVAICKPLHYMVIMSKKVCRLIVLASCTGAFLHSIMQVLIALQLPFCGPNKIDHYFCDVFPLLKLACTDTFLLVIVLIGTTGMLCILTFISLLISYIIILTTLKTHSSEGRRKALSTCGSHITVVIMFFVPLTFTYVPTGNSVSEDKVFALFYTVIAPMFNPFIYSLRNTDMKNAMRKVWLQKLLSKGK
ncbi:olfactory receptor 4P4-like [Trichosurus vulpecula]|uniref:olfactory receptor 4P4-like n=1 Tax=Trichosurus vulpecula TaxID=9337 RepID=UPI00186B40E2|nr:olfactory receptor 4P4-like [Trichosurus vulpecula]